MPAPPRLDRAKKFRESLRRARTRGIGHERIFRESVHARFTTQCAKRSDDIQPSDRSSACGRTRDLKNVDVIDSPARSLAIGIHHVPAIPASTVWHEGKGGLSSRSLI